MQSNCTNKQRDSYQQSHNSTHRCHHGLFFPSRFRFATRFSAVAAWQNVLTSFDKHVASVWQAAAMMREADAPYFRTAFWSIPPWWIIIWVTAPLESLTKSTCASTTFTKNRVSVSAISGNLGWPVICVVSWSPSSVIATSIPGASSYTPTYCFRMAAGMVIAFRSGGYSTVALFRGAF